MVTGSVFTNPLLYTLYPHTTGSQPSALSIQQKNCELETLRVFRLLTSQVFGKLLSDEESGEDRMEERQERQSKDDVSHVFFFFYFLF